MLIQKFQILAEKAFAFLETDFGFRRHLVAEGILRYETLDVFVLVVYDGQRSYELSLDIGQRTTDVERTFNFGEVLRSAKAPTDIPSSYQITSEDGLKRFLGELAKSLRTYGADILQNNIVAFRRVSKLRERECEIYSFERDLRLARVEVETAWRKKDYTTVVKILKPLRAALTATEVGKLEFAEKMNLRTNQ